MISRRSWHQAGLSLAEILVALAVGSWVVLATVAGYLFVTHGWAEQRQRAFVQRDLARAVAVLSQSLRRAGVCLAWAAHSPDARALSGGRRPDGSDTVTVRANPRCARAALIVGYTGRAYTGDSVLSVDTVQNFVPGMEAYIMARPLVGAPRGERFVVKGVDAAANQLIAAANSISDTYLTEDHAVVVGLVEETFGIDRRNPVPVLTVASLHRGLIPVAEHIDDLRIRYVLQRVDRRCTFTAEGPDESCIVSAPAEREWILVRALELSVTAQSDRPIRGAGGPFRLTSTTVVTPRNSRF